MSTNWMKQSCRVLDQTIYLNKRWQTQKHYPLKSKPMMTNTLKICTYNIWFGNERQQIRMEHLLKIVIDDNQADIICFQEVTQTLLQYILSKPSVQKYHVSGITYEDTGAYGNVIFSRFPLNKVYIFHYKDTPMNRKLVCADIFINNELFRIGTVHLESLGPNASRRVVQLKDSIHFMLDKQKSFTRPHHLLIMGDFNECGTRNKKALYVNDKQFFDAWSEYHGGDGKYEQNDPGWTMPENDYFPPWRPDRLCYAFDYDYTQIEERLKAKEQATGSLDSEDDADLNENNDEKKEEGQFEYVMKGKKDKWVLKNIKRIGMDKIPLTDAEKMNGGHRFTVFTPSDHYGLIAEFCIDKEINELTEIVNARKIEVHDSKCSIL